MRVPLQLRTPIRGVLVLALLIGGCAPPNATGTYVAKTKTSNAVVRLQIVQVGPHLLTGELDISAFDTEGAMSARSASVSGTMDGDAVLLRVTDENASAATTLTGQLTSNRLKLSGVLTSQGVKTFELARVSDSEYQDDLKQLEGLAKTVAAEREREREQAAQRKLAVATMEAQREQAAAAHRDLTNAVTDAIAGLKRFESEAGVHLQRWPNTNRTYERITADMSNKLERERSLTGDTFAGARSQLAASIQQDTNYTLQLHDQMQSLASTYQENAVPKLVRAIEILAACRRGDDSALAGLCSDLEAAINEVRPKYQEVADGLKGLEATYASEHAKQDAIVAESSRLEQTD